MKPDDETRRAIAATYHRLAADLYAGKPLDDVRTGIEAIDRVLSFIDTGLRAEFLGNLLAVADMTDGDSPRARKARADEAAQHLRQAADILAGLDNEPFAETLRQLAVAVAARCGDSRLTATMSTADIVPGTRVIPQWERVNLGPTFSGKRGKHSPRAAILRLLAAGADRREDSIAR